jgi:hypothetical protein
VNDHVRTLQEVEQGQAVRLTLAGGSVLDARVNQFEYVRGERVRAELTTDAPGDRGRYQAVAMAQGGEWSPLLVRRHEGQATEWVELGEATDVTALPTSSIREPEDGPVRRS